MGWECSSKLCYSLLSISSSTCCENDLFYCSNMRRDESYMKARGGQTGGQLHKRSIVMKRTYANNSCRQTCYSLWCAADDSISLRHILVNRASYSNIQMMNGIILKSLRESNSPAVTTINTLTTAWESRTMSKEWKVLQLSISRRQLVLSMSGQLAVFC